jgi:pimeloyl-ACP methyl ester carboxylesterase
LVLLHGYGASGVLYFKFFKELSLKYWVIVIDHAGMGASSRPSLNFTTESEYNDYFIEAIENWRVNYGLEQKFILGGHSHGGNIGAKYTQRYP